VEEVDKQTMEGMMSKLEDNVVEIVAWMIALPIVVISAIGGLFLWFGAKIGIIKK
jgi:hypothetical protein